ncbi:MAG: SPFH domain-containing protein [Halobacteriovoraceae bacterium]|nr:SPFH domain-containing protein [Halobacteriovoraceae bacterium]
MGLFDAFKKQFIDVIQWNEENPGVLSWRFPIQDQEIQNGAQLTVREGQCAMFLNEGEVADIFGPGLHTLNTQTLPILTTLRNWDKAFQSPFKSDVYFFSLRDQIDRKWGTANPITIRDKDYGHIRLRAHGTYSYSLKKPDVFYKRVLGTRESYHSEELEGQIRSMVLTSMSSYLGASGISFLDMAANQETFSQKLKEELLDDFEQYGLELKTFLVQNLSLPEELQEYLDKRSQMNIVGNMDQFARFETADNISTAAANEGGMAGMGASLTAGMAMANQMMGSMNQTGGQQSPQEDPLETIQKLAKLKDQGILTEEEFAKKKEELLKKIT